MIKGKVLGSDIDQNGNIRVTTEYTLTDGTKKIGHTRYNFANFSKAKILEDVKAHCETLMRKIYGLKRHEELITTKVDDIQYECSELEMVVKPEIKDSEGKITQEKETIIIDDK